LEIERIFTEEFQVSRKIKLVIGLSVVLTLLLAACSTEAEEPTIVVVPAGAEVPDAGDTDSAAVEEGEVAAPTEFAPAGPYVQINSISLNQSNYVVEYETFNYTEAIPGVHIHFFFNSVAPEQAGVGGDGPWYVWGGPRPFTGYTTGERGSASQICALVANADHTIVLNTGNCYDLPGTPAG
jgi:hypothetical protein